MDLQVVINELANQIKRLTIENALLKAELQEKNKEKEDADR
jgi:hypothetical protein